ncbi:Na+/H+ antiporter [Microbacterium imperiale]|uniref:Na(+)/H(+) exchanger n=1 Tax=Microbacterium imperiale TaxID=33884 RepID=A0A9W6HGY8_9MICO|nr:Na+/H+ antiporter [Microbacterium imperiale]MBP2421964.1 CPA1 family monovalent cation:H+ antiporter [Microbacterium imperiale]MDS0200123.1 Na+/H+ antiporter [Microbacterium imperiale]BFE39271.1 Na+/H+ antiporter [Microbacterium imperiale]GLJ79863.1 putative Na(+)/H(+) exchanger [Microbacterium imperiale]
MQGLEVTVLLGIALLVGTVLAPRLRVATPLVLLAIGLLLGFVPELREIELPPETMLLLFLPVMLFREAWTTSLRSVRRSLRYIVPMSTLLVVASAFAVAGVASALGVPWEAALVMGAAVAPPDATAVAALGRLLPERTFMKLKAESLTNDGTALVLYAIAVSLLLGDQVTPLSITGMVALSYLGGAAAGVAVAAAAFVVLRRMRSTLTINLTLLLVPFVSFLVAELIEASGVLAVVFAGLIIAWVSPRITTATSRRAADATWPFGVYLLNGALFVLIGLEVQLVIHEISPSEIGTLLLVTLAAWFALFVVRYVFQWLFSPFSRPAAGSTRSLRHRSRVVSTFAGFRGAVSLAIALSVPITMPGGEPVAGRDAIVFVTAGVIMLTLLVQGPLLPAVIRWAKLPSDDAAVAEFELAQRAISGAALAALDDLAVEHGISDAVRDRARREGYERLELANARAVARLRAAEESERSDADDAIGDDDDAARVGPVPPDAIDGDGRRAAPQLEMIAVSDDIDLTQRSPLIRHREATRLHLAVLDRKREVLLRLRREGTIDDLVARRILASLDLDEIRARGLERTDD